MLESQLKIKDSIVKEHKIDVEHNQNEQYLIVDVAKERIKK